MAARKTKIVHIIGTLGYGGAEVLLLNLLKKLDRSKFDVSVLSLQGGGVMVEKFRAAGINVDILKKRFKGDVGIIKKIERYLLEKKPHIVHTHLFVADFYGGTAALMANVPVIISTKHDTLNEGRIRDFLSRKIRKRFTAIVAISGAVRDYLINEEKVPYDKVAVIYNGVDINKFYVDRPVLFSQETITIGAIGRLSKEKGHKHLLRACRFLRHTNWKLLVVGDGPMRADLERSAQMLDMEGQVTFMGEVDDVRPFLNKMDIYVLPSASEGLSLSLIEAALAGRFVIATNVGGIPEVIREDETGLLFKPKNIEQLVKHLNWSFDNKDEAQRMARQLQKEALERFDLNEMVKAYQSLYNQLVHQEV